MSDDDWLANPPLADLLQQLQRDVVSRYRIDPSEAARIIRETFSSNQQLMEAARGDSSAKQLKRTRVYKRSADEAKKRVYYHLRNYRRQADADQLASELESVNDKTPDTQREDLIARVLSSHASTRERLANRRQFYDQLQKIAEPPQSIIDVGCGVQPLMFPFTSDWAQPLTCYLALESNAKDIACLETFRRVEPYKNKLVALQWNLQDGWDRVVRSGVEWFDLALILKFVPVVARQQRELLATLCETPAANWLITGSRVALTKKENIQRREKRVLEEFVKLAGRSVKAEFEIDDEFAWLV